MTNWIPLIQSAAGGAALAYATAKFARPAQKETLQQQNLAAVLQSAPALLGQGQALLTANAGLQKDILEQKNTIEALTDRVSDLEANIGELTAKCDTLAAQAERVPQLEGEVTALRQQLTDKEAELDRTRIERDTALRAQERAEGGLAQAQRTLTEMQPCGSQP